MKTKYFSIICNKHILLLISLILGLSLGLKAQKIKVVTTSIVEIDNKLVISYDLVKSKETQQFYISLEITSSTGNKISIKSLEGDIGNQVTGGTNKQIVWDYNADGIVLHDNINIEIFADPIIEKILTTKVSTGKALILSTILPGAGLSKIEKGKPYWLIGTAAYGLLGYSYMLNKKANENYDSYISNTDKTLNDQLLSDSQRQNKLSKTMAYTAIGIWSVNMVWTAIKAKKSKAIDISYIKNKNLQFCAGYDPWTKTAGFNLKLRF
jgi:hypothetical protein